MATGKTSSVHYRVKVDSTGGTVRDISKAVTDVSPVGFTWDEVDVTGYADAIKNYVMGHPDAPIDISGPFDNTALAADPNHSGPHSVFTTIDGDMSATYTLTVQIGIRAAPTTGDPEFEGEYFCSKYIVNGDGTYSARMVPASSTAPAWGTVA